MKIYIGADHRGFKLKEGLKEWLVSEGKDVEDVGAHTLEENDDYPIYSEKLGRKVAEDSQNMGVLLCGSGSGAAAAVNKIKSIRASIGFDVEQIKAGRHDDDINVLVLAADFLSYEKAKDLVSAFLGTPFDKTQERYQRRINQIKNLERD